MSRSRSNRTLKESKKTYNARTEANRNTLPAPIISTPFSNMPSSQKADIADEGCKVVRKKVDKVILYEIKENELDALEKGRQSDIFLNFSIFCYSAMLTCIASLLTCSFHKDFYQTAFFCIAIIGGILGTVLLSLWWKSKDSVKDTIKIIRARKSDND